MIVNLNPPPAPVLDETGAVVFGDVGALNPPPDASAVLFEGDGSMLWHATDLYEDVDLDQLSPRARALAEAIAASHLRRCLDIWMESDQPIKDIVRDWRHWYTPEEAERPLRRPWRGWANRRGGAVPVEPHAWLEYEARKIPAGWHVLGTHPAEPVATQVYGMTTEQVLSYLSSQGRGINRKTWTAYVARRQAPQPASKVGSTPLWDPADIIAWVKTETRAS